MSFWQLTKKQVSFKKGDCVYVEHQSKCMFLNGVKITSIWQCMKNNILMCNKGLWKTKGLDQKNNSIDTKCVYNMWKCDIGMEFVSMKDKGLLSLYSNTVLTKNCVNKEWLSDFDMNK